MEYDLIKKIEELFSEDSNRIIKLEGLLKDDSNSLKKCLKEINQKYIIKEEVNGIRLGASFLFDSGKGSYSLIITKQN